jgi:hypothetical protein
MRDLQVLSCTAASMVIGEVSLVMGLLRGRCFDLESYKMCIIFAEDGTEPFKE